MIFQRCHLDRESLKRIIVFLFVLQNQSKLMLLSPHHQQCTVRDSEGDSKEPPKTGNFFFFEFCMRNVVASFAIVSTKQVLRMCSSQPYRLFMTMVRTAQPPATGDCLADIVRLRRAGLDRANHSSTMMVSLERNTNATRPRAVVHNCRVHLNDRIGLQTWTCVSLIIRASTVDSTDQPNQPTDNY
jgi:hypothetical protein